MTSSSSAAAAPASPTRWPSRPGRTTPWPTVSVVHGTADFTVVPANQREPVERWTNVHGIAASPSASETVAGYPHAVHRDGTGRTLVETHSVTGMGHGRPVDPGTGTGLCGRTAACLLDVNLCAAWQFGQFWRLGAQISTPWMTRISRKAYGSCRVEGAG